jgi:hypothetical protein
MVSERIVKVTMRTSIHLLLNVFDLPFNQRHHGHIQAALAKRERPKLIEVTKLIPPNKPLIKMKRKSFHSGKNLGMIMLLKREPMNMDIVYGGIVKTPIIIPIDENIRPNFLNKPSINGNAAPLIKLRTIISGFILISPAANIISSNTYCGQYSNVCGYTMEGMGAIRQKKSKANSDIGTLIAVAKIRDFMRSTGLVSVR